MRAPTRLSGVHILVDISSNEKKISKLGHGPIVWCKDWNDMEWFDTAKSCLINYRGWPVHHAIECFGQVGGLYNMVFNRDDMIHSAVNFQGCGLPIDLKKQMAAEMWGSEEAIDADKNYTPMNEYKAEFAWWSIVTDVLHDSLTLCNWVWPMAMAPAKERSYRGDLDLEAQFYTAVTGQEVTIDDLYKAAERIMTLQRANTARGMKNADGEMGCNDFRNVHDTITEWVFTKDPEIEAFTAGTDKMDRDDWQTALTMMYERFGWDSELGCPHQGVPHRPRPRRRCRRPRGARAPYRGREVLRRAHPHLRRCPVRVLRRQPGARLSRLRGETNG